MSLSTHRQPCLCRECEIDVTCSPRGWWVRQELNGTTFWERYLKDGATELQRKPYDGKIPGMFSDE